MTRDQRSTLLYLETRAVDHRGIVDTRHMNDGDMAICKEWDRTGFLEFKRRPAEGAFAARSTGTHYTILSNEAWEVAHRFREERGIRNQPTPKERV